MFVAQNFFVYNKTMIILHELRDVKFQIKYLDNLSFKKYCKVLTERNALHCKS